MLLRLPRIRRLSIDADVFCHEPVETLDRSHGNPVAPWQAMGSPEAPTRKQVAELRQEAMAAKKEAFEVGPGGTFLFPRQVQPWSVILTAQK